MILTNRGQHVKEMMTVGVKHFQNFGWSSFLIRQNVNMATNAMLHYGITSNKQKSWSQHGYKIFVYAYVLVVVVSLIVDITGNY